MNGNDPDLGLLVGGARAVLAVFGAASLVAVVSSPAFWADVQPGGAFEPLERTGTTLDAPPGPIGHWDEEPICVDDADHDVTSQKVSVPAVPVPPPERVGGQGDLTRACVAYGRSLVVELAMGEAIRQLPDDGDEAELALALDTDGNTKFERTFVAWRDGPRLVGLYDDNGRTFDTCLPGVAWETTVIRVELDADCIGSSGVGLYASLTFHDTDDFTTHTDSLPAAPLDSPLPTVSGPPGFDDLVRVARYGGPDDGFASPEAAIASVVGDDYAGSCFGLVPRVDGEDATICSASQGRAFVLFRYRDCRPTRRLVVRRDPETEGWDVIDPGAGAERDLPSSPCPFSPGE